MKTVTINVHPVFGSKNGLAVEASYRGKRLFFKFGVIASDLANEAWTFAKEQGFTNYKISYGLSQTNT